MNSVTYSIDLPDVAGSSRQERVGISGSLNLFGGRNGNTFCPLTPESVPGLLKFNLFEVVGMTPIFQNTDRI